MDLQHWLKDCSRAIQLNPEYLKAILRRAEIFEETEKLGKGVEGCHPFLFFSAFSYKWLFSPKLSLDIFMRCSNVLFVSDS
jgi:hypothetical protein